MSAVRTGIGLWGSRYLGPKMGISYAQALEATGQIDQVVVWDQLQSWWPDALWTPENSPMAAMLPDMDSVFRPVHHDRVRPVRVAENGFRRLHRRYPSGAPGAGTDDVDARDRDGRQGDVEPRRR